MASVEQKVRREEEDAASLYRIEGRQREKTTNLRSKRRGRYVPLIDKSLVPSTVDHVSAGAVIEVSPETLALVQRIDRKKAEDKLAQSKRRQARSARRRKFGGKKR